MDAGDESRLAVCAVVRLVQVCSWLLETGAECCSKNTRSHAEVAESEAKEEAIIYMLAAGDSRLAVLCKCARREQIGCVYSCAIYAIYVIYASALIGCWRRELIG